MIREGLFMHPILYRKKTKLRFFAALLLLALCIRLLCTPGARESVWKTITAVLRSETLLRTVVFLETGILPNRNEAALPADADVFPDAPAFSSCETVVETEAPEIPEAKVVAEAVTETTSPVEEISFSPEEADAIRFRGDCSYEVDKAELLLRPLGWQNEAGPKVLIIHSHSCESYTQCDGHSYIPSANYRTLDLENNVVAVGDALAEALAALGVELIHDRTYNDYPDYNSSYAVARKKIQDYLEQYPSIVMVLDLHRDALENPVRETVELDGQTVAPLMLVIGTDEGGLHHPHWEDNLSCGLKLQALANREDPDLFKRISFRQSRFNGDLTRGSLIVEVGSTENTLPEACAAMPYLAQYVEELLRCP